LSSLPLATAALAVSPDAGFSSKVSGIQIGAQTYSYRSLRDLHAPLSPSGQEQLVDRIVDSFTQDGINSAELDRLDRTRLCPV
jgi:hypothetical protein